MAVAALVDLAARRNASCNLVGFPYAGGGPGLYRSWVAHLPPWVGVFAAHLAGREGRFDREPISDLPTQVAELTEAVRPLLDRPLVLYGHSLGATLAAHVAQELFPHATKPAALIVGARSAPWAVPCPQESMIRSETASDTELLRFFQDIGGVDEDVLANKELLDVLMPALRADAVLSQAPQYLGVGAVDTPVYAVFGDGDDLVPPDSVRAWERFSTGPFQARSVRGDHFFVRGNPSLITDVVLPAVVSTTRSRRTARSR
ncbi:thioesterase II family protein [Actinophytocola sp.]|uniref:thioesterase II family protein n=1 Tax=Actinophytocola sp. TaxID=1872138 RepID=UPI00389ACE63